MVAMKIINDYSNLEYIKIQSLKKFDENIFSENVNFNSNKLNCNSEESIIIQLLHKQKIEQEENIQNYKHAFETLQNLKKSISDNPYKAVIAQFNLTPKALASMN